MPSLYKLQTLSEADYLNKKLHFEVRHKYVDSTARHNRIALRLALRLAFHLAGIERSTFISGMKVHTASAFYYPDVVVIRLSVASDTLFVTGPRLIVEVLSESTQGRDRLEKRIAYRSLGSLQEYLLVAQEEIAIEVYRRAFDGWKQLSFGPDEDLELASEELRLPICEIYAA